MALCLLSQAQNLNKCSSGTSHPRAGRVFFLSTYTRSVNRASSYVYLQVNSVPITRPSSQKEELDLVFKKRTHFSGRQDIFTSLSNVSSSWFFRDSVLHCLPNSGVKRVSLPVSRFPFCFCFVLKYWRSNLGSFMYQGSILISSLQIRK